MRMNYKGVSCPVCGQEFKEGDDIVVFVLQKIPLFYHNVQALVVSLNDLDYIPPAVDGSGYTGNPDGVFSGIDSNKNARFSSIGWPASSGLT